MIGERQAIWGWKIAVYLFLAGAGAGAYVLGVGGDFAGDGWGRAAKTGVTLGPIMVAIGTLFLTWDLGKPLRVIRAASNFRTSWITRGVYILSAFIILGFVHFGLWVWPFHSLEGAEEARRTLGVVNGVLGVLTMVYTGLLLGAVRPIPFWSTPVLPLLFLVSALSTGIMAVSLILSIDDAASGIVFPHWKSLLVLDSTLLVAELLVLTFYLAVIPANLASAVSVQALLRGDLAPAFWGGLLVVGLLVPLVVGLVNLGTLADASVAAKLAAALVATVPGLTGGLILRLLVVTAGVKAPLLVLGRASPLPGGLRLKTR